jgi:hypothetical protein
MKIWTLTSERIVLLIDGKFVEAPVEYINNHEPIVTLENGTYFINKLA